MQQMSYFAGVIRLSHNSLGIIRSSHSERFLEARVGGGDERIGRIARAGGDRDPPLG